jgi:hypothetical protein
MIDKLEESSDEFRIKFWQAKLANNIAQYVGLWSIQRLYRLIQLPFRRHTKNLKGVLPNRYTRSSETTHRVHMNPHLPHPQILRHLQILPRPPPTSEILSVHLVLSRRRTIRQTHLTKSGHRPPPMRSRGHQVLDHLVAPHLRNLGRAAA